MNLNYLNSNTDIEHQMNKESYDAQISPPYHLCQL